MRLVFCGTPEFAVPTLHALLAAGHEVPLVLTQPDRPAGRSLALKASAVKHAAEALGLAVLQPERLRTNGELQMTLGALKPDAIVVVAYGRLIPPWMLELPRLGHINLHGSLLPKYRGAAPIQWAVANGEVETGVSTMKLDVGMDTGDVLLERSLPIGPDTMAADLLPELASIGAGLVTETLAGLAAGTLATRPQVEAEATLAPILTRDDGLADFGSQTAGEIYNRWRGFFPWPGAYTRFRGKRFLLHRISPVYDRPATESNAESPAESPGEIVSVAGDLLAEAAGGTLLRLEEVQMEGKARMTGAEFARGFQVRAGERLG